MRVRKHVERPVPEKTNAPARVRLPRRGRTSSPSAVSIGIHRFGRIFDEAVNPSPAGQMVADIWTSIPDRFPTVVLDLFVVMPNHIHGLLWFEPSATPSHPALGDVIGWFKAVTTNRYIHGVRTAGWPPYHRSLWQRTIHEHIVRNDADMDRIRTYIDNNPATWHEDRYHEP